MKIRRFYSNNMRNALRQVTEEFGEDAAILSSQKTATGVEVIAALDYDQDLLPESLEQVKSSHEPQSESAEQTDKYALVTDKGSASYPSMTDKNTGSNSQLVDLMSGKSLTNDSANSHSTLSAALGSSLEHSQIESSNKKSSISQLQWSTDPGLAAMKEELQLMREMMSEQLRGMKWQRFVETEPTKAMLARRLASLGINKDISDSLLPQVKKQQDAECSWQNLLAILAKSIQVNCQSILSEGGTFAFMGPTGAGKTTTIAKIAARFVIKHGTDSVALISTDNYRISAQHQLASFARLIGVPMTSVSSNRSLDDLLIQFKNKKLVLIDTAGMSAKDTAIFQQLETIRNSKQSIKRFLMMPATNQTAVLQQSIELFKAFSPYSVIISKVDEAASLGEVLSLLIKNNLPVAFTTDGQRVPEDIRLARSHHLVSKAVWLANKYAKSPEEWQLAQALDAVSNG
jgi:flagellar biosynthesis protein FlhF